MLATLNYWYKCNEDKNVPIRNDGNDFFKAQKIEEKGRRYERIM